LIDLIRYTSHTIADHYGDKILNSAAHKAALPTLQILTGLQPTYEGQLVMSTSSAAVFYVLNGLRYYCSEEALRQRGLRMTDIKTITLEDLEKIPLGENLPIIEDDKKHIVNKSRRRLRL
jgi:hypothetical protein